MASGSVTFHAFLADPVKDRPSVPCPTSTRRYVTDEHRRWRIAVALAAAAAVHVGVLFGHRPAPPKPIAAPALIEVAFALPAIAEIEEPEDVVDDATAEATEEGVQVPMLADLPQAVSAHDFVQQIDFSTLVEKPNFEAAKVIAIPEGIRRGVATFDRSRPIFDLRDLDRHPAPIFQPAPRYPANLRREGISGRVVVQFIVDAEGHVHQPVVIDSTDYQFNAAAVDGVTRWRFRPGIRAGQKVNTRMEVPLIFRVGEE